MKSLELQHLQMNKKLPETEYSTQSNYIQKRNVIKPRYQQYRDSTSNPRYINSQINTSIQETSPFPRNVNYIQTGTIPNKTLPMFPSRSISPNIRRLPPYIPVLKNNSYNKQFHGFNDNGDLTLSLIDAPISTIRPLPENKIEKPPQVNNPVKNDNMKYVPPIREQDELFRLMKERKQGRRKSPFYFRALREMGGIQDTMEGLDESLQQNEIGRASCRERVDVLV